jgi:hypothetical protein
MRLVNSVPPHTASTIRPKDLSSSLLGGEDFERYITRIAEERNWAPASVNRYRALISLVFRLGIENGKFKENPARVVKHRQVNKTRTRWLAREEEVRLRVAIKAGCPEHCPNKLGSELRVAAWRDVRLNLGEPERASASADHSSLEERRDLARATQPRRARGSNRASKSS